MKRRLLRLGVLLLVAGGLGAWWFDAPARLGWAPEPESRPTLYGNVDIRQVELGFRVSGRVAEMVFEEGDRVEAGTVLARLDARPYEDGVEAAEARVAARAATLAKLQAGPRAAEIARAKAEHAEQVANLANAEQEFERARQLRTRGAISQAALDQARAVKDMAAAAVVAAREELRLLEEGTRVEDLAVARANLKAAEADLSVAGTALEDTQLRAPSDGIILSRVRERGAITSPGDTVYVLSLTRPVWVRTYVPEPLLGRIHPGMEVEVVSDSAPDRPYRGRIGFISPVAEFTPKTVETPELRADLVYRLRVIIGEADAGLRQGMPVTVRLPPGPGDAGDGS